MALIYLTVSYPDFVLGQTINPDEFDQNNKEIIDKINEIVDTFNTNESSISTSLTNSQNAVTTANNALTTAQQALNKVPTEVASQVATAVAPINTTANSANTKANDAVTTANAANAKAVSAVETANTASSTANTALSTANTASTTATDAKSSAQSSATAAQTAQTAAEQAAIDAKAAQDAVALKVDKSYVDETARNFTLGIVPDKSIDAIKLKFNPATSEELKIISDEIMLKQITNQADTLTQVHSFPNTDQQAINVALKGRTVINLLGSDGDCENIGVFNTNNCSINLDSVNKVFGNNGIAVTLSNSFGNPIKDIKSLLTLNSYYCMSAYAKNNTSSNFTMAIASDGTAVGCDVSGSSVTDKTKFNRTFVKLHPTSFGTTPWIYVLPRFFGANGDIGYIDGIMLNEITQAEYNDPNYQPPEYTNNDKSVENPIVVSCGKNLFDKNKVIQNVVFNTSVGTIGAWSGAGLSDYIPVKDQSNYVRNLVGEAVFFDKNKNYIGYTANLSFITPSGCAYIRLNFTLTDIDNIQLEEGSVTTPYEPYKGQSVTDPFAYRECNGVRDERTQDGKRIERIGYKVLDGSLGWVYNGMTTGVKRVCVPIGGWIQNNINAIKLIKDNSKLIPIMPNGTGTFQNTEQAIAYIDNYIYIDVLNTDSGWGDAYTPTVDEIKAYFNGWRMYDADIGASSPYNGTGTKKWYMQSKYVNNQYVGDGSDINVTCPTIFATGYTPYRMYYQLVTPIITDIPKIILPVYPKGTLSVDSVIKPYINFKKAENMCSVINMMNEGTGTLTNDIMSLKIAQKNTQDAFANYGSITEKNISFTPTLAEKNKVINMTGTLAQTITIPANSSIAFPIGTQITFNMQGSGTVSFVPSTGVTLYSKDTKRTIDGQYASATLIKINTDIWILIGALKV